jgi:hypothetical protein
MRRLSALLLVALVILFASGCSSQSTAGSPLADALLRAQGGGAGIEVETLDGKLPAGLQEALNPGRAADSKDPKPELPAPPKSTLQASGRVTRPDGSMTYLVAYEVKSDERTTADVMRLLVDAAPWQLVRGRTSAGVSLFDFEFTRSGSISGAVVVQQEPTTKTFDMVVSRDGKERTLKVRRLAFEPALAAELEERDGGVAVTRVVPGEAATAGLQSGDRLVRIGGKNVTDTASMQTALRSLEDGKNPLTSVVMVLTVALDRPVQPAFALPSPSALPEGFPAQFLLLEGLAPVAVDWSIQPQGRSYDVTWLSRRTPSDVSGALRQAVLRQGLQVLEDTAKGFGASISFGSADGSLTGTVDVDVFPDDDAYAVIHAQIQVPRQPAGGLPRPVATPTPAATPAPSATPAR